MVYVICLMLLGLVPLVISRNIVVEKLSEGSDERWLSDGVFYDYMADSPVGSIPSDEFEDKCPPVPKSLIIGACEAIVCNSDRECNDESFKCCYNGCTYTCRPRVQPPPFVDWIQEPRRRLSSGRSWLVNGPDTESEVEICSTSPVETDEDPLLCPHGYFCNIEDEGKAEDGIPNRGHCVKKVDDYILDLPIIDWKDNKEEYSKEEENRTPYKSHGCLLDNQLILEQASLTLDGQKCRCKSGVLVCQHG